jgi:yeast amino acid transporter
MIQGNWNVTTFIVSYITIPIFGILWASWKIAKKTRIVPLDKMDFVSGLRELDEEDAKLAAARSHEPQTWYKRIWNWLSKLGNSYPSP